MEKSTDDIWITNPPPEDEDEIKEPQTLLGKVIDIIFTFLESIALGGAFFVVVYLFVMQPHQVKGNSMYPTYHDKEYILTDKISYKFRLPERGDVIILKSPKNPDIDFIKRIIALPGETLKIESGQVYLNNSLFKEPYLQVQTPLFPGGFMQEGLIVTVPENMVFVMGDNRPGSSDSREFGFIPMENIIGRVFFRYFPVSRAGMIEKPNY